MASELHGSVAPWGGWGMLLGKALMSRTHRRAHGAAWRCMSKSLSDLRPRVGASRGVDVEAHRQAGSSWGRPAFG
jgi:hypothetical protein